MLILTKLVKICLHFNGSPYWLGGKGPHGTGVSVTRYLAVKLFLEFALRNNWINDLEILYFLGIRDKKPVDEQLAKEGLKLEKIGGQDNGLEGKL